MTSFCILNDPLFLYAMAMASGHRYFTFLQRNLARSCRQYPLPGSEARRSLSTSYLRLASNVNLPDEVDFNRFETLRKEGKVAILDVREAQELAEVGEIPGCVNIPLGEIEAAFSLGEEEFEKRFGIKKPTEEEAVVTLCLKGIRSEMARNLLMNKFEHTNVANYRGSFAEWIELQGE